MDMNNPPGSIQEKCRILVVDDEPGIVNALRRELSTPPQGRYHYAVEAFTNPLEALERAKTQVFEVVLSDYRMPEMDGLSFLKALTVLQPDCVRIVLSGQTDLDSLIRMVNETHIYRFIPKPWSTYFLKSSLAQAIEFRQASVANHRLAQTLRTHGIDLPLGSINSVDQILIVDDEINVAHAVARSLTQRNRFDDMIRETEVASDLSAYTERTLGPLDDILREVLVETHSRTAELIPGNINVQISNVPQQALQMADDLIFSCVIADYHMAGMDGGQFLASFAEKQPDCATILLSGTASMEGIVVALDLAHIQSFIAKPWSDYDLRSAVAQALTRRRLQLENRVLAQMCMARNLYANH